MQAVRGSASTPIMIIRKRRRLVTSVLLALLLAVTGATSANATTKVKPTLTVTASPASIAPYGTSTVSVVLKANRKPVKSATLTVQQRFQGSHTWGTLSKIKTNAYGKGTVRTTKRIRNVEYRAVYAGSTRISSATSSVKLITVKQSVTITKASGSTITAGSKITLSGTTSPALVRHTVSLQLLSGKTWKTISSSKVTSKAAFSVSGKATQGGTRSYRVYATGSTAIRSAASRARTYKVYSWYYLSDLGSVESDGWDWEDELSDVSIGGTAYPHSPGAADGDDAGSYNLSYRCTQFRATIGIDDESSSAMKYRFAIRVDDGDEQVLGTFGVGRGTSVSVSTGGGFRLHLENAEIDDGSDGWAVWGNARLLCLTRP